MTIAPITTAPAAGQGYDVKAGAKVNAAPPLGIAPGVPATPTGPTHR